MAVAVRVLLAALLGLYWSSSRVASVTFSLTGYDSIPTNGSGRILITDINPNEDSEDKDVDALICRSESVTTERGNWYLNSNQQSTDADDRIDPSRPPPNENEDRGWIRNRGDDSGHRLVRLRRSFATAEEGVFTCDIPGDDNTPRALGIYYPMSVSVSIGVVSGREGTFRVTCTATGGTLSTSSLTGPGLGGEGLQLQAVGSIGRTGQNTYSVTNTLSRQSNGATYTCTAMNDVSSPEMTTVLAVAGNPTLMSLEQSSPTRVIVRWSSSSEGGATVTGYVVHYKNTTFVRTKSVSQDFTSTILLSLTRGATYTISVEATSQHLSGESEKMNITLQLGPPTPSGVMVDGVNGTSVRVSWQTVDDADRYNVTFTKTLGKKQQGLCKADIHIACVSVDAPSTSASFGVGQMLAGDDTTMLRAYTTYSITVVAESDVRGSSEDSQPVTVTTAQTAPSAAPTPVTTSSDSPSSITIQWGVVPCIHRNGDITGYSVQYGVVGSESTQIMRLLRADASHTTISGLRPSRMYSIQVAAWNSAGIGPHSDSNIQITLVEAPLITVTMTSVTSTTIPLTWTSAGSVVNSYSYKVEWTYDGECSNVMGGRTTVAGDMTIYTIEGLEEYITYSITVTATNNAGSAVSEVATGMTSEAAPSGPPTSVRATSTSTSITVRWGAVDCIHHNGDITGYSVQYRVMGSGSTQALNVSGYSVTISSLMLSTTYSIEVAAVNSAGTGVYSDLLIVQTENVYLSLNEDIIPNHGYVVIGNIGSTDETALVCHTNRPATLSNNANSGGDWFAPDETRVTGIADPVNVNAVPGFGRNRAPMVVRLLTNTAIDSPSEGIYHCLVEDDTLTKQTVYVGLYNAGGGNITISDYIMFTMNPDFNGASPQFTLTCISTGGPATTVTWTRDSDTVSEGTETVLDEPVTAQYTHILIVTGRLGGVYTCTVGNNRPSQVSAALSVQVARSLTDVTVTASGNTVTVMWSISSSGDDVTGYLVHYHHPNYDTSIKNISTNVHSDIFTEHNDSQRVYAVTVQALSRHLPSALSGPVTARVPGSVQDQLVEIVMNDILSVSWEEPAQPNDYTLNYTVSVTNISAGTELSRSVLNETQLTVTLPHTPLKGVPFNVTVFATNGKGNGESVSKVVYVEEDVPHPLRDVVVKRVNVTHMEVRWTALSPVEARGHITHYTISYWPASNSEPVTSITVHNTTNTSYRVLIGGLLPGEAYVVEVSASTAEGDGEKAEVTLSATGGGVSLVAPVAAVGTIVALIIVIITVSILLILLRRKVSGGSSKVKSKPLPPLKTWKGREEEEEEEEEMEMRELVTSTEEDKDDYYFEDPSNIMTARQDIPEAEFPDYVKQMHQEGDKKFNLEFQSLDKLPQPANEVARLSCNKPHNRFKNIYPYDSTRVKLTGDPAVEGSDYINASFIEGYPDKQNAYIAAQGPTEQTVGRFWQMVWENQLTTIVMLTRCVEDGKVKCEQYWPDQLNSTISIGSEFTVTVTSFVPSAEYQVRKLLLRSVSDPEQELTVTHMYYTAWPDHGVPRNAMSVISFIHRVRKEHPAYLDLPLLVHCSAGVGRTGTFILLDSVMQQIKREGTLSVFNVLKNLRGQRMKMVQTKAQYVFIHDSLSELVVCGETDIVAADIRVVINEMMRQVAGDTETTGFQKEFQTLEKVSAPASYQEAEAQYNANKNRFPDKLPNELGRVRLRYSHNQGSDYINASFIDGYKQLRAYIATHGPLQGTVEAFWRMVWEHHCSCVVMLCEEMENGEESCHCFWPQGSVGAGVDGVEEVYGKLAVSVRRVSSYGDITERKLEVEERGGKETHRVVTLLQMTGWSPQELPHPSAMLALVDLLSKAQRSSPSKHTIIMCSDGVGRTGTFICLHSQLERLKTEGVVDFFQAVKSARIKRAGLVPDAAHYAFCHEVVASYVDSFETYANFKEVV